MTLLERVKMLCNENGISQRTLEKELELGNGALSKWGKSSPSTDALQKIADFFGVSLDWLTGNSDFRTKEEWLQWLDDTTDLEQLQKDVAEARRLDELNELNKRDERDIAKRLENALADLENSQEALMFSGEPLDDETRELLKASLENSIRIAKINAKQKYTPKRYRKGQ